MPCFHPMHAFENPYLKTAKSFAPVYTIKSIKVTSVPFSQKQSYKIACNAKRPVKLGDFDTYVPMYVFDPSEQSSSFVQTKFQEVPCGHCLGCRLDHAKEWTTRIYAESQYHTGNYFLTLTYDDSHLKYGELIDPDTLYQEEVIVTGEAPAVSYDDLRKFFMRLRYHFAEKHTVEYEREYFGKYPKICKKTVIDSYPDLVYYACTEYGPKTHRPHAHAVILGLDQLDWSKAQRWQQNFRGEWLYIHPDIASVWQNGYITIAPLTEDTIGYVSRYTLKKSFSSELTVAQEVSDWKRYYMDCGYWDTLSKGQRIDLVDQLRDDIQWQHNLVDGEGFLMPKESQYMSTGEAIGTRYWRDHYQEICRTGELWINHKQFPIPRSFYLWLKKYDRETYDEFHDRVVAKQEAKYNIWLQSYDQTYRKEFLEKQGQAIEERSRVLLARKNVDILPYKEEIR